MSRDPQTPPGGWLPWEKRERAEAQRDELRETVSDLAATYQVQYAAAYQEAERRLDEAVKALREIESEGRNANYACAHASIACTALASIDAQPGHDDGTRWVVADAVTGSRIYPGEYPRAEAEALAARLGAGYKYQFVRVADRFRGQPATQSERGAAVESEAHLLRQRDEWANHAAREGMRVEAALAALRVIAGPADREPLMDVYRAAGGGYEGLQAVARHALAKDEQLAQPERGAEGEAPSTERS